ncbi:Oidioi.mRNA.OKI2018_I69.chr1.g436.t1.cds [Oikopleura dioica]|uniref:Oidioi.mRNA.OKI2018_I69.chr1.g436.t1.cds n=1 Tax=Oikopleura dioica TaxID=34765 RepID=A0ABN7SR50_OIKDI|nr:Oidioi.mRNA.OKI2018_I69.chr1.g436.t1.cds [Oikopleura dioica]
MMADLTEEERNAYEDQYTRGLRKMRDFRVYTKHFVDEIDCLVSIWPEKVILEERNVPEQCKRLDDMKTMLDQKMWKDADKRPDDIGKKVQNIRKLMQDLENTLKIHFPAAVDRYYLNLINTSF